jgi:hypothetical protein
MSRSFGRAIALEILFDPNAGWCRHHAKKAVGFQSNVWSAPGREEGFPSIPGFGYGKTFPEPMMEEDRG